MFRKTPLPLLRRIIKMTYHLPAVSYTNFGIIDHNQLSFKNCRIEHCYLTGTYRNAADFQLSVSTFHNICTLNCTLVGTEETRTLGQNLLEQVKKELIDWSKDNWLPDKGKEKTSGQFYLARWFYSFASGPVGPRCATSFCFRSISSFAKHCTVFIISPLSPGGQAL